MSASFPYMPLFCSRYTPMVKQRSSNTLLGLGRSRVGPTLHGKDFEMAAKRQAISDLNHDNWDKEEEAEDPGHFREASGEELKNRVIKKARRRITGENDSSPNTSKSIFSGFSGFASSSNPTQPAAKASPFAFLSKLPTSQTSTANTSTTLTATTPTFSFGGGGTKTEKNISDVKSKDDTVYFAKIMKLNKSFCDWIVKHVSEQPLCNLTPTFKDYERFLQEIEQESKKEENTSKPVSLLPSTSQAVVTAATTSTASSTPFFTNFKFNSTSPSTKPTEVANIVPVTSSIEKAKGTNEKPKEGESLKANGSGLTSGIKPAEKTNGNTAASTSFSFSQKKANGDSQSETSKVSIPFSFSGPLPTQAKSDTSTPFSFGLKTDDKPALSTGFSFGLKKTDDAPSSSGFSFMPGGTPFTFANIKPPAAEPPKENNGDDDDEDQPPKVEVKEIVEEDALYTKRCKVFVKKDNAFKDHGVGTFYLKPVKDSDKTQLLVRSSNNLGTILINVILVEGMPTQRMGKNNVMLVHPGSEKDGKPQTTLFRVKDGTEADELLEMINKHKK